MDCKGVLDYRGKKIKWFFVTLSKQNIAIIYRTKLVSFKAINIKYKTALSKETLYKILKNSVDKSLIYSNSWNKIIVDNKYVKWKLKKHIEQSSMYEFKIKYQGNNFIKIENIDTHFKYTKIVNEIEKYCIRLCKNIYLNSN